MNDVKKGEGVMAEPGRDPALAVPVIRSEDLLAGGRELAISHAGELYRLRRTRKGRLILTK